MARPSLNVRDRILLHLLELDRFREESDVPSDLCQEGIAKRFDMPIQNVSRGLASLLIDGMVTERLGHVSGAGRRRKVYFLTDRGHAAAVRTLEQVKASMITVSVSGEKRDVLLDEVVDRSKGTEVSASKVLELLLSSEPVSIDDEIKNQPANEFYTLSNGRPTVDLMIGRDKELADLQRYLWQEGRTVIIWGLPGIGKSTLGSVLFDLAKRRGPAFWHDIREWDDQLSILNEMSAFLSGLQMRRAHDILRSAGSLSDLLPALASDLARANGTFFFDDVQKASPDVQGLVSFVSEVTRHSDGSRLVLMTRSLPKFIPMSSPNVKVMEITGLDRDSSFSLAQAYGYSGPEEAISEIQGNPLLISLRSRFQGTDADQDTQEYVEDIFRRLGDSERDVLEMLAGFREPVPLAALPGVIPATVSKLRELNLVLREGDRYWVHDLVRPGIERIAGKERLINIHRNAAAYYAATDGPGAGWEELYHLAEAREWESVFISLERYPDRPIADGKGLWNILSLLPEEAGGPLLQAKALLWKGKALSSMGRHVQSLEALIQGQRLVPVAEESLRIRFMEEMAEVHHAANRLETSLEEHTKALKSYEEAKDVRSQVREWLNIGRIFRETGEHERAMEAYDRAASLQPGDENLMSLLMNNRALVLIDGGKLASAEAMLKQAALRSHRIEETQGEEVALLNLAWLFRLSARYDEMDLAYRDAIAISREADSLEETTRLIILRANALWSAGREDGALEALSAAEKDLPRRFILGDSSSKARLRMGRSRVEMLRSIGRNKEAATAGQELLGHDWKRNDPELARLYLETGLALEETGEDGQARRMLSDDDAVLRSLGDSAGLVAVLVQKGMLEEKAGDQARALSFYREALWKAETSDDRRGQAAALENIALVLGSDSAEGTRSAAEAAKAYRDLGRTDKAEWLNKVFAERSAHP